MKIMSRQVSEKKTGPEQRRRVFVGLSGGVDSAVSAALLSAEGGSASGGKKYDVTGVFIKVWTPPFMECTWKDDRLDAMRVAAHLGIPFKTLDLEKEYKKEVVDYMIAEYEAGRVPNPDVMCNRSIKFGAFYNWALENGAEFVATGHYAQVAKGKILSEGADRSKDQSYFLWGIKKEQLPHILFPVGGLLKTEVRKLAQKFTLPNADKRDSQGLCFMGKVDMQEFLSHFVKSKPGTLLDESGKSIGTHPGAVFFTLGQRHGFLVTEKTTEEKPYYVVGKDIASNTVTVSHRSSSGSLSSLAKGVIINHGNWLDLPKLYEPIFCRFRYRQEKIACTVTVQKGSNFYIEFEKPQNSIPPGQSLVLYRDTLLLGGGVIETVI